MSSSLFYDCYAPYESYARTEYVDGDKTFGEVGVGDILYGLGMYGEIKELKVKTPFHVFLKHCYITIEGKGNNIDFGPSNCANVLEARDKSIVYYNGRVIGTNKESVKNAMCSRIECEVSDAKKKYEYWMKNIERIKSL